MFENFCFVFFFNIIDCLWVFVDDKYKDVDINGIVIEFVSLKGRCFVNVCYFFDGVIDLFFFCKNCILFIILEILYFFLNLFFEKVF